MAMITLARQPRWQQWLRGNLPTASHANVNSHHRNVSVGGRFAIAEAAIRPRLITSFPQSKAAININITAPLPVPVISHRHLSTYSRLKNAIAPFQTLSSSSNSNTDRSESEKPSRLSYQNNYHPTPPKLPERPQPAQDDIIITRSKEEMSEIVSCQTIEKAARIAHRHAKKMSPRDISTFWSHIHQLMQIKYIRRHGHGTTDRKHMNVGLRALIKLTTKSIHKMSTKELSQTTLSLSRIMNDQDIKTNLKAKKTDRGRIGLAVRSAVVGEGSRQKRDTFDAISRAALPLLKEFEEGELADMARAYGTVYNAPKVEEDGRTMLDHIAEEVIARLEENDHDHDHRGAATTTTFVSSLEQLEREEEKQLSSFSHEDMVDILQSYSIKDEPHPLLFEKVGDAIVEYCDLASFEPREMSTLLWSFAILDIPHPRLFDKMEEETILVRDKLETFDPRSLATVAWAYAKTEGSSHSRVFDEIADVIINNDNDFLDACSPEDIATILWAFVTAADDQHPSHHPQLFQKVANKVISFESWKFDANDISTIVWAFATCKIINNPLLDKMEDATHKRRKEFDPRGFVKVSCAYALVGPVRAPVFSSLGPHAGRVVERFSCQELASIAWAYAVANVAAPSLFNDKFIYACFWNADEFTPAELCQLHQWQLWQEELKSYAYLPLPLPAECHDAFTSSQVLSQPSALGNEIISELSSMGLKPEIDVHTEQGYRIDATLTIDGNKLGIAVEEPSHFLGDNPTGETVLRRRQVGNMEGIKVAFVPFWEWSGLGQCSKRKQLYLRYVLGLN